MPRMEDSGQPEIKRQNAVCSFSRKRANGFHQILKRIPDPQNIMTHCADKKRSNAVNDFIFKYSLKDNLIVQ